jgi:site-specific recombinase XerD
MKKLLDLHLNFLIRSGRTNVTGETPIVLRIVYRNQRRDIYTGLYCQPADWDKHHGGLRPGNKLAATINENLDSIRYNALKAIDLLKYKGSPFTIDDLIRKIKGEDEQPVLLQAFLLQRKEELRQKVNIDISQATFEKYERVLRYVFDLLISEYRLKNYPLAQVDIKFLEKYFHFLRSVRNIGNNTAIKYLGAFRTLLAPALKEGIIRKNSFLDVKMKHKTILKGYLTNEELQKITEAALNNKDLDRIRDQFLFCCYTGLAYIDLRQLGRLNLRKDNDGSFYIEKARQKTGQPSIIPLLHPAIRILEKYSRTGDFRDFFWKVSSNQKMNLRLKTIGTKAGLDKLLHMHLARHTFATTITLSNDVPIESVSAMLGHATIRQTMVYAKVVTQKLKNDMKRVNKLFEKNQSKHVN